MPSLPSLPSSSTEPKKGKNPKKKEKSVQKSTTGLATESKKLKKKNKEKKSPNEKNGKKKKSSVKKASNDATTKPNNNPDSVSSAVIPQSVLAAPHPNQTVDTPATTPGNRLSTPSVAAAVNQNAFKGLSMTSMKDPHDKGVRCMFAVGSVLFTASEDGEFCFLLQ